MDVPLNRRSNLRSLACATEISKSTLHRRLKEGDIRRHSSAVRPMLSEKNKVERVRFALSHIRSNGLFEDMYDHVHIDEKWFYMTKFNCKYYLLPEESDPDRKCQSKRFFNKVMFMAAVARPRWIPSKKMWFNGLIGIWPYVKKEPAKRNSKNRLKGTLVTKTVPSVTNEEHLKMMENNVIPAILSKWPKAAQDRPIFIQQDNSKPHGVAGDERLRQKCLAEGWHIKFRRQPPNSPEFNVLDLGFFAAIQALQHEESPANIDELINHVDTAFHSMKRENLLSKRPTNVLI